MESSQIPVYSPYIGEEEAAAVADAVRSGWVSVYGTYLEQFSSLFSTHVGRKHCVLTTTGTSACHLVMLAAGIGPGNEVLVPALTYIATANAVSYVGAKPVIADVDLSTWNMTPETAEPYLTPRTKAVFLNHLYGNPCDKSRWEDFCKTYGLILLEDACEGLGGSFHDGSPVGSLGLGSSFSFFGNKTITTGQGGAFVCDDPGVFEAALQHAKHCHIGGYRHNGIGQNYLMTNTAAAIGYTQCCKIDNILERKRALFSLYIEQLGGYFQLPTLYSKTASHSCWMFALRCRDPLYLSSRLAEKGIESRPSFVPLHRLKPYLDRSRPRKNADWLASEILVLPTYPALTMAQAYTIAQEVLHVTSR